jgi:hypothetical protein
MRFDGTLKGGLGVVVDAQRPAFARGGASLHASHRRYDERSRECAEEGDL